jgi:FdhD protein
MQMLTPTPPVPMPIEQRTTLVLNDIELLTVQTTPVALRNWAEGFLYTEGIISSLQDLRSLVVDEATGTVRADVDPELLAGRELAATRYLTSGCGKGVTFSSIKDAMMLRPVRHGLTVAPEQLAIWIRQMQKQMPLYAESGGMHGAAVVQVATGEMVVREDIGRHNAVDKAIGAALEAGWPGAEVVLLTTGRMSYEMCAKMARYCVGVGASLTAATDQAVRLANRLGIDLLGYVRRLDRLALYTAGARLEGGEQP